MGYVVCKKCRGYYELQEGENIHDFLSCQCGGELIYIERIFRLKDLDNHPEPEKDDEDDDKSINTIIESIRDYDNEKSSKIDHNGSTITWEIGSKRHIMAIMAIIFILLYFFTPFTDFNQVNSIPGQPKPAVPSNNTHPADEKIKAQAAQLIEKSGYWSIYHKKLKNEQVKSDNYISGLWYGDVDIKNNSIQILSFNNSYFIVQYKATHHCAYTPDSNPDNDKYFDEVYLYTEKAVKSNGRWKLVGPTRKPQYIKNESYKIRYSSSTKQWYREKIS